MNYNYKMSWNEGGKETERLNEKVKISKVYN